jgi:hypothetical protein
MRTQKITREQSEQIWLEINKKLDKADLHIVDGKQMWLMQTPDEIEVVSKAIYALGGKLASVCENHVDIYVFGCITVYDLVYLDAVIDCAKQALFDLYAETAAQRILGIKGNE